MFNKILIANRGEIALRIIRTCKELGIKTVAVYSEADRESLHVTFADEAVCIGQESYLKIPSIISAAQITGADAIHPGYGFLAENADFSEICNESDITFIGPSPEMIRGMGDKSFAKDTMRKNGVPVIPGSDGIITDVNEAIKIAYEIGFPVIVKASAGGGGKGMRIVWEEKDFEKSFQTAQTEAEAAFDNSAVYIEKYLENPRHVEFQVMGDSFGNVFHYGERDCSVQRRHQKLIEESPSPALDEVLRVVLVKQQILIAAGQKGYTPPQKPVGHSIEFRINAEDPDHNFRPSPGKITSLNFPGGFGVRVDSHIYQSYTIPPYYDSLVAKLIVWGKSRERAIARAKRALGEFVIEGIKTTIPFHLKVLEDPRFISGHFDTGFLDKFNADN